jgi:hypothetical protein
MAATRIIEEERGAYVGHVHAHNGYYAGDFSGRVVRLPVMPNIHPVSPTPARPFLDRPPRRHPGR